VPYQTVGQLAGDGREMSGEWSRTCLKPDSCGCEGWGGRFQLHRVDWRIAWFSGHLTSRARAPVLLNAIHRSRWGWGRLLGSTANLPGFTAHLPGTDPRSG